MLIIAGAYTYSYILQPSYTINNKGSVVADPIAVDLGKCIMHENIPVSIILRNTGSQPVRFIGVGEYCTAGGICFKGNIAQGNIPPQGSFSLNCHVVIHRSGVFADKLQIFIDDNGSLEEIQVPVKGEGYENEQ